MKVGASLKLLSFTLGLSCSGLMYAADQASTASQCVECHSKVSPNIVSDWWRRSCLGVGPEIAVDWSDGNAELGGGLNSGIPIVGSRSILKDELERELKNARVGGVCELAEVTSAHNIPGGGLVGTGRT